MKLVVCLDKNNGISFFGKKAKPRRITKKKSFLN